MRKVTFLLTSLLILSACGENPPVTDTETGGLNTETEQEMPTDDQDTDSSQDTAQVNEEGTNESKTEEAEVASEPIDDAHVFENLFSEETFNNEFAYQTWEEYKKSFLNMNLLIV